MEAPPKLPLNLPIPGPRVRLGLSVALLLVAVVLLVDRGRSVDWDEVLAVLHTYDAARLATALGFAALAYGACSSYDLLARRYVRHGLAAPRVLAIDFVSYAVNLNLGALLGGMGFRYRLYSRHGVDAGQTTQIIGLAVLANWIGWLFVAGLALAFAPPARLSGLPLEPATLRLVALLPLAAVVAYLAACLIWQGRTWTWRDLVFECPTPTFALAQLALSSVNWLAAAAAVAWLLPATVAQAPVGFAHVLIALLASALGGLVIRLPAGLGVLEATFLALLGGAVGHGRLLAALLAFRAVYYLLPLAVALLLHAWLEWRARAAAACTLPRR